MNEVIHLLLVLSLQREHGLIILVHHLDYRVFLILDLLLQQHVVCGGRLQRVPQVLRNDHVHDVHELDIDPILVKALVKVVHKRAGQLALDVADLADLDQPDVVADRLLTLLLQELFELVRAKVIEELLAVLLAGRLGADVEGDTDVHGDLHVVFRGATLNLQQIS